MVTQTLTFRGERDAWLDFTHKVKKDKKIVWDVLKLAIEKYGKN